MRSRYKSTCSRNKALLHCDIMSEVQGFEAVRQMSDAGEEAERVVIALADVRTWQLSESSTRSSNSKEGAPDNDEAPKSSERIASTKAKGSGALRSYSVSIRRDTITLVNEEDKGEYELAHKFEEHTYGAPTYCDVCNGLLVGLWSQGLKCASCGRNTHRGGGIGDHDDCRAEAMLTPCDCAKQSRPADASKTLGEAMKEVRELTQERPNFFQEVRAQMEKDAMTHVKNAVVSAGVEDERQKKFRRAKEKLAPLLEFVDGIEAKGEIHSLFRLLMVHAKVALVASVLGIVGFFLAVLSRHGRFTKSSVHLALVHESTVLVTVHIGLLIAAATFHFYASRFKRKVNVVDQFLRSQFGIDAKEDFGVSVEGVARRARWWSERIFITEAIMAYAAICWWYAMQPSMDTLLLVDGGVCPAK